ncbi:MAG: TPM domain-containing protein [Clostridia bacterium]|nr:TPM domain-containing protein [Clostridia bacterium]
MNVKRIASLALCALMLCAAFALAPFAEENCPRYDDVENYGFITAEQETALKAKLDEISERYSFDVAIVAVDNIENFSDINGEVYDNYGNFLIDYYDSHVYPDDYPDAAILLYEKDGEYNDILAVGGGTKCIDSNALEEKLAPYFENGEYYDAFDTFADECEKLISAYRADPDAYAPAAKQTRGTIKDIPYGDKKIRFVDLGGTGVLTEQQQKDLMARLDAKSEELQFDIVVVTVDNISNYTDTKGYPYSNYADFADDFYDYYGNGMYGYGDKFSGALIMYEQDKNYRYISTCGEGEEAVDFETAKDDVIGYFNRNDFNGAFNAFADSCERQVLDARSFHFPKKLIIALVIALIIAFIAVNSMKSKLTSVKFADSANNYVRPGSLNLTESRDTFLYSAVTRTVRQTESRSGGGGGSHTSSSGRSHGGGGF